MYNSVSRRRVVVGVEGRIMQSVAVHSRVHSIAIPRANVCTQSTACYEPLWHAEQSIARNVDLSYFLSRKSFVFVSFRSNESKGEKQGAG